MSQMKAIVDKLLTNVSQMYVPEGYISESILPNLQVKQKTGKIGKYGLNHLRIINSKMGGRGQAQRFDPIIREAGDLYSIESYGLEGLVTQDDIANVEEPFDAEKDETMGLTSTLWTSKEFGVAKFLFDTTVITNNVTLATASDKFSDYAQSKPLELFKDAHNTILDAAGRSPNRAITSKKVFNALKYHPAILRTLGFADNRAGTLTEADLMKALDVETIHIADAAYNSSKMGQADQLSQIWGDSILFYYAPKTAAKYQQSLGYYMTMSGRGARKVYKFPVNNPPESKGIIVQDDYEFRLTNTKCGFLLKNVL